MDVLKLKAQVRERDGLRCARCGMTNDQSRERYRRQLDVHRVQPGSVYSAEGCVTLCQGCHGPEPRRQPGEPDLAYPTPRFAFYVQQELLDALGHYCEAQRIVPDKSEVMRVILREFLEREGFWPPKVG
jgi:hypothetical protein